MIDFYDHRYRAWHSAYVASTRRILDELDGAERTASGECDCIAFEGLQGYRDWPFVEDGRARSAAIQPRFSVNTADAVIDATSAGLGVSRVMS